jgi:hypothetical protein
MKFLELILKEDPIENICLHLHVIQKSNSFRVNPLRHTDIILYEIIAMHSNAHSNI